MVAVEITALDRYFPAVPEGARIAQLRGIVQRTVADFTSEVPLVY